MAVRYDGGAIGDAPILEGMSNPGRRLTRFDDFFAAPATQGFQLVELNDSGTDFVATITNLDEHGGVISLNTIGSAADDGVQLGSDAEFISLAGKEFHFEASVRFATAVGAPPSGAAFVGMAVKPGTAALTGASIHNLNDMIGFQIDPDDSDSLDFVSIKDDTETKLADVAVIAASSAATPGIGISAFCKLGFRFRNGELTAFIDGEKVGTVETNIPTDEPLGISIAVTNGNTAAACVLCVDYVMVSSER